MPSPSLLPIHDATTASAASNCASVSQNGRPATVMMMHGMTPQTLLIAVASAVVVAVGLGRWHIAAAFGVGRLADHHDAHVVSAGCRRGGRRGTVCHVTGPDDVLERLPGSS